MKRIRGHLVGVDQGLVNLFSDFATDGEMWTGEGTRERSQWVAFSEKFRNRPIVQVALSLWDMDSESNVRADIGAEDVSDEGFNIVFRTWGDTRVARVRMSWIAFGEVRDADDWDVES